MHYSIRYSCISHIGKVRKINQDNYICDGQYMETNSEPMKSPLCGEKSSREISLFGVFDGMGGEECGEVASCIAAQDSSALELGKDILSDLSRFCQKANEDICRYARENEVSSMGTTAAMLAFADNSVTLCNIGDSKIFLLSAGKLEQISEDHVAAAPFGVKPPLSQNLGIPPTEMAISPYLAQGVCRDGDIYLICSDGLTDMVTTEEIAEVLLSKSLEKACTELLQKALSNGGRDNITIILCKIERESGWFFKRKRQSEKKEG